MKTRTSKFVIVALILAVAALSGCAGGSLGTGARRFNKTEDPPPPIFRLPGAESPDPEQANCDEPFSDCSDDAEEWSDEDE